jgi:hypothetical protein
MRLCGRRQNAVCITCLPKTPSGFIFKVSNLEALKTSILTISGGHDDDCGIITSG